MRFQRPLWLAQFGLLLTACAKTARADVVDLPPPLETVLPEPPYVVAIGLALSVIMVLLGARFVAKGKLTRRTMNILLFLVGAATAITAVYSKKLRVDYAKEVERARESYSPPADRGGWDDRDSLELEPTPLAPDGSPGSVDPPVLDPPALDPPEVDPPEVDPPEVDPPEVDPPAADSESSEP